MAGYHVIRIAVDPMGQPISGSVECVEHRCNQESLSVDVGPFDTTGEVFDQLRARVDIRLPFVDDRQ